MTSNYQKFYKRSIESKEEFWREQSELVDWETKFSKVLEYDRPPFSKWFVGGKTNLCHNALDRHVSERGMQPALVYVSTETGEEKILSYSDLLSEVNACASLLKSLGVGRRDRVLIYMPMIPEAIIGVLACVRIGAIHCIVFGGFASQSLATRIDDCKPKIVLTADAGMRGGRAINYKPLLDEALKTTHSPPKNVIIVNRGLDSSMNIIKGRDLDYENLMIAHRGRNIDPVWLESSEPSYIVYTSGTTGRPKGVQRDTGGYAVALAASMKHIYCGNPGETMFTTSDIGWVVGHSYIIYGPLLAGMTTIVYEGLPIRPDPSIWWSLVEKYKVSVMFSAPTAIRVLKKHDEKYIKKYNLSSLRHLFLAGEPLDVATHKWATDCLGRPVIDHFWQTETGWPILTSCPGVEKTAIKYGSPSFPAYGYDLRILRETDATDAKPNEKGVVAIEPPLPPGCMTTVWQNDERFVDTYFKTFENRQVYSTFDWGIRDEDGYYFILGRTDDVINVAGHRLGTREIEEAVQTNPNVSEVAVVGVRDDVKGQLPVAFVILRDIDAINRPEKEKIQREEIGTSVDSELGAIGRPGKIYFVRSLPKTRSGKLLRRSIQALCEGTDPGDLTTLEDPSSLEEIRRVLI